MTRKTYNSLKKIAATPERVLKPRENQTTNQKSKKLSWYADTLNRLLTLEVPASGLAPTAITCVGGPLLATGVALEIARRAGDTKVTNRTNPETISATGGAAPYDAEGMSFVGTPTTTYY